MKLKMAVILCIVTLLAACGGAMRYEAELDKINRIADDAPERAMAMLDSVRSTLDHDNKPVMMYHSLLTIKARDKAYITHTSDSIILEIINHYENEGDSKLLPLAYYYGGRVYSDLGDAPQALEYFQKSWELLKDDNTEFNSILKSKVPSQLNQLFFKQNLYHEAKKYLDIAYHHNLQIKDTVGLIYNLRDYSLIYNRLNKRDCALHYSKEAYDLSKTIVYRRPDMLGTSQLQFANQLYENGKLDSALFYLKPIINNHHFADRPGIYVVAMSLYYDLGELDSTEYYAKEIIRQNLSQGISKAYGYLTQIEERRGDMHKTLVYLTYFKRYEDSISRTIETELITKLNAQYNYQLREKKNHELEAENNRKTIIIFYVVGGLIIISLVFLIVVLLLRRKHIKTKFQLYKIEQLKSNLETTNSRYIAENEAIIASLKDKIQENSSEKELIQERLRLKEQELKTFVEYLSLKNQQNITIDSQIESSDFINEFKYKLSSDNNPLTQEEWTMIITYAEHLYPTFKSHLLSLCVLTEIEYKICVLVKLRFTPVTMSVAINRSKESISSIRRRLYLKIFNQKGKPSDFDEFIASVN